MKIIVKVFQVHSWNNIEEFNANIEASNYLIARAHQEMNQDKIVRILKGMEKRGIIKSIRRPRNKKYRREIENLVNAKKEIKKSIDKMKIAFN